MQEQQIGDLYIPRDERALRSVQRRVEAVDDIVREWSQTVMSVLPRSLPLIENEGAIISLFLAQQRRLNLELDSRNPEETFRTRLGKVVPFLGEATPDLELIRGVHRVVLGLGLDIGPSDRLAGGDALHGARGAPDRLPDRPEEGLHVVV